MKTPLRTNRIISNITQSSVVYGTEANAIDALQLSLDSPTPLGGDRWCWDGRQWIRLNVIDLGSKYYLGLLLSQESGNIQVYKAHGDIIGEGGGKLNGLTFEFLSSEDANDTATQLITKEGGNAIVIANPSPAGTTPLTGLQVNETKYVIEGSIKVLHATVTSGSADPFSINNITQRLNIVVTSSFSGSNLNDYDVLDVQFSFDGSNRHYIYYRTAESSFTCRNNQEGIESVISYSLTTVTLDVYFVNVMIAFYFAVGVDSNDVLYLTPAASLWRGFEDDPTQQGCTTITQLNQVIGAIYSQSGSTALAYILMNAGHGQWLWFENHDGVSKYSVYAGVDHFYIMMIDESTPKLAIAPFDTLITTNSYQSVSIGLSTNTD